MSEGSSQPDWLPHDHGGRPGAGNADRYQSIRSPSVVGRVVARLIDGLIVAVPVGGLLAAVGAAGGLFGLEEEERAAFDLGAWVGFSPARWAGVAALLVLYFAYAVVLEWRGGATVGKKALRLRVVAADGGSCSLAAAAKRNLWLLLGLVPYAGSLLVLAVAAWLILAISSSPDDRGSHDVWAGTSVTR